MSRLFHFLGVPIRVEFGPNDKSRSQLTVVLRHTGAKSTIPIENCETKLREILEQIHNDLYAKYEQKIIYKNIFISIFAFLS